MPALRTPALIRLKTMKPETPRTPAACDGLCPVASAPAFTLIELLTVIAIIGILAAILIPTVSKVRESARQSVCISRLRELGTAFQLHANDHKDLLPQPEATSQTRWPFHVAPYVGPWQIRWTDGKMDGLVDVDIRLFYKEPVFRDPANAYNPDNSASGTFGYNINLETRSVRVSNLSAPGYFPVMSTSQGDVGGGLRMNPGGPSSKATKLGYTGATSQFGPAPNYGRKAVFLFADWHVKAHDVCDASAWPWNNPDAFAVK
ncbi:prepilin-type N-terminal cleavage/methylation domain-containing protein [Opitutaceae bacterium TAV1]|nr:prepilin-type N-terminal cleavage/methylation domain-containing protein [Opitutaceae bacterium TAV1]